MALRTGIYYGLGYMFHQDYTGIDLDHCVTSDRHIDSWAWVYLDRFASYAEYSPSGTGIHILVRGTIASGLRRQVPHAPHPEAAIEMYCTRRYFTITGNHVSGTPTTIEACPDLHTIHAELTAPKPSQQSCGHEQSTLDDETVLDKARQATNGATFQALWNGDISGYVSASEADLALCHLLAFWTTKDTAQIDRLFRRSALYRPQKWDRAARSGETYGQGTIERAITGCHETYASQTAGKIIHFRRKTGEDPALTEPVSLPETQLDFVLACLQDEEEGDARLYAHLFRGKCVYDHTEGIWYEWQGHSWQRDDCKHSLLLASGPLASVYLDASAQLAEEAAQAEKRLDPELLHHRQGDDPHRERYEWLRAMTSALIGRAKALKKLKRAQAVLTYAQAYLRITSGEWDTHPWLLACANGVLDLHTGELAPGTPDDYLKTAVPTEWSALETPASRWEHFLQEIFQDKPEHERETVVDFLQRLLGYGITGTTSHHVFTILYGEEGRNGKDTLLDTLKDVLGPLVGAVSNDLFVAQDKFRASGAPTPHLCDLQGKRLVWGSETRQGDKLNIAQIKLLSGGGAISTRQLHGRQCSFTPTHKLLLMTNYKPHADARDQAFWSRACLLEFGMRFVAHPKAHNERQADPGLKEKLKEERSGIVAWVVRGCLAFQELGLAIPASISLATEKYRDEEDRILHFLTECCAMQPEASVKAGVLYEAYKTWCEENQFGRGMNATLFGNEISRRFEKKTTKIGRIYQGVGILTAGEGLVKGMTSNPSPSSCALEANPDTQGEKRGEGLVKGLDSVAKSYEGALEANKDTYEMQEGEGCEGLRKVFPQNAKKGYYMGKNHEKPFTPFTSSSIEIVPQAASEGDAEHNRSERKPFTNPSPKEPLPEGWEEFVL
jgi:putative DNA primase/helicase